MNKFALAAILGLFATTAFAAGEKTEAATPAPSATEEKATDNKAAAPIAKNEAGNKDAEATETK